MFNKKRINKIMVKQHFFVEIKKAYRNSDNESKDFNFFKQTQY